MEIKKWTYEEFPEFDEILEDVAVIGTTGDEIGISYVPDVEYVKVDDHALHLQMLIPSTRNHKANFLRLPTDIGEEKKYPCIVFVQGSAWMEQNVYVDLPMISCLAQKGYVIAVVEYRHSGIAAFPAQVHDTKNAIRFLKIHADEYMIDSKKMIVAGDSSGGHAAVFSGIIHDDLEESNRYPGVSAETCGIIDLFGSVSVMLEDANPTTLNHCLPDSPEGMVMGGVDLRENPELRRALSAECNIDETTEIAPMLIMHGTKDRIVNAKQSVNLYHRMREVGKNVELVLIRGADRSSGQKKSLQ